MQYLLNPKLLNLNLVAIVLIALILTLTLLNKYKKNKNLISGKKKNKSESKMFKALREQLYITLLLRNKEHLARPIYRFILLALFSIFIFFLSINHLFLAITMPTIIYYFTIKIIKGFIISFDEVVKKNFPTLANHMAKVFSRTSDLSVVLYESSKEVEEPLRSLILNLSRELMVDTSDRKLINFIEKTDNLWLHSFIFTLINYKETSSKEDIVDNLLTLAELIEKRKDINERMIENRKPVVIVNYMLLIIGVIIFIGNIILNPMFKPFIFTPLGTFSLLAGVSCIFLTIIINMKFTKMQ